jgi:hypothetical protein
MGKASKHQEPTVKQHTVKHYFAKTFIRPTLAETELQA